MIEVSGQEDEVEDVLTWTHERGPGDAEKVGTVDQVISTSDLELGLGSGLQELRKLAEST